MKSNADLLNSPLEIFTRNMFTQVIQKLSVFLAEGQFSISEIAALHILDQGQGLSVNSVAQSLNLSKSATSRLLAGLEEKGLLRRKPDPTDSRAVIISTSAQGKHFLNEMSIQRTLAAENVIQSMPAVAAKQLLSAIGNFKKRSPR